MVGNKLLSASRLAATAVIAIGCFPPLDRPAVAQQRVCIATFNVALHGQAEGEIRDRLDGTSDPQAKKIASIVQIVRPDVLLVNELDCDPHGTTAKLLADNYFAIAQANQPPMHFPHIFTPPSNTGLDSGRDLDGNGELGQPNDAWGYGTYAGQYGFAVFSRFPVDMKAARTFQQFCWSKLPGAIQPSDPVTGKRFYDEETWQVLRLSSKNHVDLPILIGDQRLHLLASHPTPPVFDGEEDRNGRRNHDEIRFWIDYLAGPRASYLMDDQGRAGGLQDQAMFVIAGDLNSDPTAGDSRRDAIRRLLSHERVQDPLPSHRSGDGATKLNNKDSTTADFGDIGRLRVDYVLPSRQVAVKSSGVFWPEPSDRDHSLVSASDHRLVWVEVEIP